MFIEVLGPDVEKHFPEMIWPNAGKRKSDKSDRFYLTNAFFASTLSSYFGSEIIMGLDYQKKTEKKCFNSAFHFIPGIPLQKRYDKQVLVPIGEYLPFSSV